MSRAEQGDPPLRLGVSACLLGQKVRHDAGHKRDPFVTDWLDGFVEWVPICPEVELGMGIPRPPIRLERTGDALRLVSTRTGDDHGPAMRAFAARRVAELERLELSGCVLEEDSPSCGMERVRVWSSGPGTTPERSGRGAFAAVLMERMPLLPIEEAGRLHDTRLRESFVERIFAYRRLRTLFAGHWRTADLSRFHVGHELQLLAHGPKTYPSLARLIARSRSMSRAKLAERYGAAFMAALARPATRRQQDSVLRRALGHLGVHLDASSRGELAELIEQYRRGIVPLLVPISSMRHHVRALGIECLAGQVYLDPHPQEVILRNHA